MWPAEGRLGGGDVVLRRDGSWRRLPWTRGAAEGHRAVFRKMDTNPAGGGVEL